MFPCVFVGDAVGRSDVLPTASYNRRGGIASLDCDRLRMVLVSIFLPLMLDQRLRVRAFFDGSSDIVGVRLL